MPGNIIRHDLERAFRLSSVERETKLVKAARTDSLAADSGLGKFQQRSLIALGEADLFAGLSDKRIHFLGEKLGVVLMLEFSEERLRQPSSAVVRPEFAIIDHHYSAVWRLKQDLAWRHQNSEISDRSLRREAKPLPEFLFERALDSVELSVLGAAASSDEAVADSIHLDPGQRLFNDGLFTGIKRLCGYINCGHADTRMKSGVCPALAKNVLTCSSLLCSPRYEGYVSM